MSFRTTRTFHYKTKKYKNVQLKLPFVNPKRNGNKNKSNGNRKGTPRQSVVERRTFRIKINRHHVRNL